MATISEMFTSAINEANKTVKTISDPTQKTMAYAAIAAALAATGSVNYSSKQEEGKVEAEGKESLKNKPSTKKEEVQAATIPGVTTEVPEKAVEPANTEQEFPDEWTEETLAMFKNELDFIKEKQLQYGDEPMDNCVKAFSNNIHQSITDISPFNIRGLVDYIKSCEAAA